MPYGDPIPVDNTALVYQLMAQVAALNEKVAQQGQTIEALVSSVPPLTQPIIGAPSNGRSKAGGLVYREWVSWLSEIGPAYRQDIIDGVRKTLPGNQPVVDWTSIMATWPNDAVPSDTLCKINGKSTGQGRPPTIYFLWSQRFDIYGRFGVGPESRPEPQTLLGVIHPPLGPATVPAPDTEPLTGEPLDGFGLPANEWDGYEPDLANDPSPQPEPTEPTRYATMDEWHERWDQVFDMLAANDAVATAEEKEQMLSTMPEDNGVGSAGTVLAMALHEAKQRVRSN